MQQRTVSEGQRSRAKEQRRTPTRAQEMLWGDLRGGRFDGLKFRRQVPIGSYLVDFVCFEVRIVVELDLPPHDDPAQRDHDRRRDAGLRAQGFQVLCFANDLIVGGSGELVLNASRRAVTTSVAVHPSSDPR